MTSIFGILNISKRSFSDGGYDSLNSIMKEIHFLFASGASYVDIGAQPTSYGTEQFSWQNELKILQPILEHVKGRNISIDTYHPEVMEQALNSGITMINDVSFGRNEEIFKLIAKHPNAKYVLTHSLVVPSSKTIRSNSVDEIIEDMEEQIQKCYQSGMSKNQIIVDPGIGFGADAKQSLEIISHSITKFKKFGLPLMVGHSRKSFFADLGIEIPPQERDIETLAASLHLKSLGVDYIRVHNVEMHKRAFRIHSLLNKGAA